MTDGLTTNLLGRTGLEVTKLGYGALEVRSEPPERAVTDQQAHVMLNAVLDAGINYIDTSIDYGGSEELIGKHISHRRGEFYLASKCGCPVGDMPRGDHVFTPENIIAGVNQSLARMKTDYLDLVQLHGRPAREELEELGAIQALMDLKKEGKVRFIGASSSVPALPGLVESGVFDAFQIPYSGLQRDHEEWITRTRNAGAGTVIRGGVAKGGPDKGGSWADAWASFDEANLDELREGGESRAAFMLRFTLAHPALNTTIVGTKNPEHLKENLAAARKGPLAPDVYGEAKRRLGATGVAPEPA